MAKSVEEVERVFRERRLELLRVVHEHPVYATHLAEVNTLAALCGISLEEPKCVLCGDSGRVARGSRYELVCCVEGNECQNRLLARYREQLTQGAR